MKHTLKRTLSALLVLCLFVGLMPQITIDFSTAKAAAATMYYDFTKANTGSFGADGAAKRAAFAALTYNAVAALNTSIASDPWAYHSYTCVTEDGKDAGAYAGYGYSDIGLVLVPSSRKTVMNAAVKVKVANAGKYMPFINIHGGYFSGYAGTATVNFRAINSDGTLGTTLASKELFLADYPEANTYVPLATQAVSLSAAEYALELIVNNEHTIIPVDGFKLLAADSATLYSIDPTNSDGVIEVKVGETITIPFTQKLTDGSTSTTRYTGWNWTTNNSYVTAEVNSRSQYYSITGTVATTKPQTIEFWNGAIKARV
ncbi:MAG: hypothetical protein IKU25_03230, partial [Clostridia bacterium]|nr:hypothetical protein [Clostridia bacterium]